MVSECLELSDEGAGFAVFVVVLLVVVGSKIVVSGCWVVEEVPADDKDGSFDCYEGFGFPSSSNETAVAFSKERVGSCGADCCFTKNSFEVTVSFSGCPGSGFGSGLNGSGCEFCPGHEMGWRGELGHV